MRIQANRRTVTYQTPKKEKISLIISGKKNDIALKINLSQTVKRLLHCRERTERVLIVFYHYFFFTPYNPMIDENKPSYEEECGA